MPRPIDREKWRLWAERVWRFEQSGLTGAEWCRQEGLPLEQFYLWRRKLQAHGVAYAAIERAGGNGVGGRGSQRSLTGPAHAKASGSLIALAGRSGRRSARGVVSHGRRAGVGGADRPQETGNGRSGGRQHGRRGSRGVASPGAVGRTARHLAELDISPLGRLSTEPAAARRAALGDRGVRSLPSQSSRGLVAPDHETFLPVELVQPQWVELILTNGVQIRVPAADECALRTVIETAGSLFARSGEPRTSATALTTREAC